MDKQQEAAKRHLWTAARKYLPTGQLLQACAYCGAFRQDGNDLLVCDAARRGQPAADAQGDVCEICKHPDCISSKPAPTDAAGREALIQAAGLYFKWAYIGVVYLAQIFFNRRVNEWPAGQTWSQLNGTSRSIFLKQAREALGIDHELFLTAVRSGKYDIDDIYETSFDQQTELEAITAWNTRPDAVERASRALKCLDYRLTGAEAVIALNVMQEFATLELAAERERIADELTTIRNEARHDAQEWLVNINALIAKLRGKTP